MTPLPWHIDAVGGVHPIAYIWTVWSGTSPGQEPQPTMPSKPSTAYPGRVPQR